jgi:ClpP class serine protease
MGNWHDLLYELRDIKEKGGPYDELRRKYLRRLYQLTGRNVIVYYSGWLQKPEVVGTQVTDADKNGFMTAIHRLNRSRGLDLILHTPGGETAATESLVDYLREMFGTNIRAIVPQLALSAGTMIACACNEILMGKHSSLGPIDPQLGRLPAHGVVEEFRRAFTEIKSDPTKAAIWQPILAKYHPTFIGECEKAIQWSEEMVKEWLSTGMLRNDTNAQALAEVIHKELADHALTKSHARHLSARKCKAIGMNVNFLEENHKLQEAVLCVHHACIHTLSGTGAFKIIENHLGVAYIQMVQQVIVPPGH